MAYYTPPHDYYVNGEHGKEPHEAFARRAHVRVLKWDSSTWREQWDSGGYGMEFRARLPTQVVEAKAESQRLYTGGLFGAEDISGDGLADIMFTRSGDLADGDNFEAWTWDRVQYRRIAFCAGLVRIQDGRIVLEYDPKGIKTDQPHVLTWDGKRFVPRDMPNAP